MTNKLGLKITAKTQVKERQSKRKRMRFLVVAMLLQVLGLGEVVAPGGKVLLLVAMLALGLRGAPVNLQMRK